MAKSKYNEYRITDIVGILDIDEDGKYVVIVDNEKHDINTIFGDNVGYEIALKLTDTIEV